MADTPIVQSGVVTPGHAAVFVTDGVVEDGGAPPNGALTTIAITNNGGLALAIGSAEPPSEYTQFGIAVNSGGTITLSGNTYGGGPAAVINFEINGTSFTAGQLAPIGAGELVGNPGSTSLAPVGVTVGSNLTLTAGGTLNASAPEIAPGELVGNPGTGTASPIGIVVGNNLTLNAVGTLSATTEAGSTTTITAGAGLTGGTISGNGTISLGTMAATSLFGNPTGSGAVGTNVAVGAGLTLSSGGTLSVGGTATLAAETVTGLLNAGTVESGGAVIATGSVAGATGTIAGLLSAGTLGLTTPLSVANGGVGAATLPSANVLIGNGTSAITGVAPGTDGYVLTSTGSAWQSAAIPPNGVTSLTAGAGIAVSGSTGAVTVSAVSSFQVVGTYILASVTSVTPVAGSTYAGSALNNLHTAASYSASGTWRCMGPFNQYYPICGCAPAGITVGGLFLRIA
jgi:fibronectin-binding autotransporter adhesin